MGGGNGHPYIVFAGGGTGGHLYPLVSIAREIRRWISRARFCFLTTQRAIDERVIRSALGDDDEAARIVSQSVMPFPTSLRGVPRFIRSWRASMGLCRRHFRYDVPDAVIGSGGYGSGPPICTARRLGVASVLLNLDAVPGRANRFLASKVDAIFSQWPATQRHLPHRVGFRAVGCPVRPEFESAVRAEGLRRFDLDGARKTLLITGASQGARSINEAVAAVVEVLWRVEGWQFLHLTGEADLFSVREAYGRRSIPATVLAYTEHMADALAAADLVVSRAGASTLAEITAVGVASVLMPYPYHRDRHQYANASVLVDAGAAVMVKDGITAARNAGPLGEVLTRLMRDRGALDRMGHRAAELGTTTAAATIAQEVLALAGYGLGVTGEKRAPTIESEKWRDSVPLDDDEDGTAANRSEGAVDQALVTGTSGPRSR